MITIALFIYDDNDINISIKENIIKPILANSQKL